MIARDGTASEARIGQVIGGKYRVIRLMGQGGMGQVYEAIHTTIGRRFAIKCLQASHVGQTEILTRFRREAETAGSLENENIAAVIDFGTLEDGSPYLIMEYLEGEDLAQLLTRLRQLSIPRAVQIAIQACRGLAAAHARGIVHRDLKPENLFICKRSDGADLVKVLDFGIAKLQTDLALTQTGAALGTPYYMSLEQARGAKDVDLRADIYALGVIIYEMLTGKKPHPGSSYNEILYHVISEQPIPLESLRSNVPQALSAVVHRAMARDAADRFASAMQLSQALEPFAERAVTPESNAIDAPLPLAETLPSPVSLPAIAAAVAAKPRKVRSGKWFSFATLALVAGLVLATALFVLRALRPAVSATAQSVASSWPAANLSDSAARAGTAPDPEPSASAAAAPDAPLGHTAVTDAERRPNGRPGGQRIRSAAPQAAPVNPHEISKPTLTPGDKTRAFDRNNPYSD